jgi:hypothetical protein
MKYSVVVTGLALLVVANVLMVYQYSRREPFQVVPQYSKREGFQALPNMKPNLPVQAAMTQATSGGQGPAQGQLQMGQMTAPNTSTLKEGFNTFLLSNAGGAKDKYESIGNYDGVVLSTGNNVSSWRYTAPNEKLLGDEFVPGDDNLFLFKNNQCKPECCGASFSCGGGCVCTTPQQRQYLASRGGNQTAPADNP